MVCMILYLADFCVEETNCSRRLYYCKWERGVEEDKVVPGVAKIDEGKQERDIFTCTKDY